MKKVIFILIAFGISIQNSFSYDLNKIRKDYIQAVSSEKVASRLYSELKEIKEPSPLILAYLGSSEAVKAKHAWNPINKMGYLKKGCKTLNEAVSLSPNQIEIRFLRFSLEHYLPDFLGYSKHLDEDKRKLIELSGQKETVTKQIDKSIFKNIVKFLIDSKRCTPSEIAVLNKITF